MPWRAISVTVSLPGTPPIPIDNTDSKRVMTISRMAIVHPRANT